MSLMESIGYEECEQIAITYTDPNVSEVNRTIIYTKQDLIARVKITYELKEGVQPGDLVYLKSVLSGIQNFNNWNPDNQPPGLTCPGSYTGWEADTLYDEPDIEQLFGPAPFPFTTMDYGDYKEFYDNENNFVGWVQIGYNNFSYSPIVDIVKEQYTVDLDGNPVCDTIVNYNYIDVNDRWNWNWFYSDEFGVQLQTSQTEIKVYEESEPDSNNWTLKETYTFQGDKTPVSARCTAGCDDDCIELWDPSERYRICLCDPVNNDATDTVFPNLDAPNWDLF